MGSRYTKVQIVGVGDTGCRGSLKRKAMNLPGCVGARLVSGFEISVDFRFR